MLDMATKKVHQATFLIGRINSSQHSINKKLQGLNLEN